MGKVKLGDYIEVNPKAKEINYDIDVSFVPMQQVGENGDFDSSCIKKYSEVKKGFTYFQDGDVLFAKITPCMENGKGALAENLKNGIGFGSTEFHVLRANKKFINNRWLYYLTKYSYFRILAERNMTGSAGQKRVPKKFIEDYRINLISLTEQQQIADTLDKVSDLIAKRKQQLEKLDLLIKSHFVEMFGDPIVNDKNWNISKLSEYLNVIGGYAFKSSDFKETGIPVLRIGNINSGYFTASNMVFWENESNLERYKMFPGDLVMSLTGTVGKDDYGNVCILGDEYNEYYLNQRNAKLEIFGNIDKLYLSELLKVPRIKKQLTGISRGVRQANISNKDILNLSVPIPPLELQNQFADFVTATEQQKEIIKKSLETLETLKASLMQKYFG